MGQEQGKGRLLAQLQSKIEEQFEPVQAQMLVAFARQWYSDYPVDDQSGRQLADLYAALVDSWEFIQQSRQQGTKVRLFNPDFLQQGWELNHTVVEILAGDMPFLMDSVRGELNRRNIRIHSIHSAVLPVVRDRHYQLRELLPPRSVVNPSDSELFNEEALLYLEIGRIGDEGLRQEIYASISSILEEVEVVVGDFKAMTAHAEEVVELIRNSPELIADAEESATFMEWLRNEKFTFLGFEQLQVDRSAEQLAVHRVQGTELGLLRSRGSLAVAELSREIERGSAQQLAASQISISKSSVRSRIHRQVYPDYIGIKLYDASGQVCTQFRFLGLFTSQVYTLSPASIPLIRKKVRAVLDHSALAEHSHAGKDLAHVLEVFPRDELFQSSVEELFDTTVAVNNIQERRQVRLFVRVDSSGKFVNCLVYTPRDIYRTELRAKMQTLLCDAYGAMESEFSTYFSDSILTRTHFILRVDPAKSIRIDVQSLEEEVMNATMSWQDHLCNYLIDEHGEEQGSALNALYSNAFAPGYMHDFEPRAGVGDIAAIEGLQLDRDNGGDDLAMKLYRQAGDGEQTLRLRLIHLDRPVPLSDVMPILENLGLRVESEHPHSIKREDGLSIWVHEFLLTHGLSQQINFEQDVEVFQRSFLRIWNREAESDSFNKLILAAGFGWRQIAMLRAYSRYMKQIQFNFSGEYIADTLYNHLPITRQIVALFNARFDCERADVELTAPNGSRNNASKAEQSLELKLIEGLDSVENLGEDRIIRHYLALIKATVRTNYFQTSESGELKNYFSFKLVPSQIPDIPLPVPMFEIFVYSPRIEGVHLRGGKVARGGLRWSDRQEDFRTEVLGLVKAQQVKNAVIVPTGAKGGFVARQLSQFSDRAAMQAEGISCYKIFIQALLDITDNLDGGTVVVPVNVLRKDDDDTYLVVAADKGTATFSDIANDLSLKAGFWLGDAFASGGSEGYDHKKMGITAKGAWVSVQRHFREMAIDVQRQDFTVVGVGDMGGDVFGNGMLLSEHIQLLCAFNHLHIFVDPTPNAASSFVERQRLFEGPSSGWGDYEQSLISAGGGVFLRSAKSITISAEMKKCFDISAEQLTPNELIKAVLLSPADLFWNGGIGTYVKSSAETHGEVGDKANDTVRVDGGELRFKVLGEGGNLGMTQLSRVEYALAGGRCNTDFIDNAAGVDCSDHEVNIKILLNGVIADGDMTAKQRNQLLGEMTESISELVLANNYQQSQALSAAERESLRRAGEYRRLIQSLESSGRLNRQLEFIPEDQVLVERKAAGKGLTRPELSVLISYVKSQLKEVLVDSSVPDDSYMLAAVESAFPERLRLEFNSEIHGHRLRREIISTQLANDLVNTMGITFVSRMGEATGVEACDIMRAYVTARDVFELPDFLAQIEALDYKVDAAIQLELIAQLVRLVRRASRWFIRNRRGQIDPGSQIDNFKAAVKELREAMPRVIDGKFKRDRDQRSDYYQGKGVPEELASAIANATDYYPFLGIIEAAQTMDEPVERVAALFFSLSERLELDWFARQITNLPIENNWQAMARETFRDDLEWQQRSLTVAAMRHICERGEVEPCVDRWMEQQKRLVARWRVMLAELQNSESQEFAMYSVAIRELLDLAQNSKYVEIETAQ